MIKSFPVLISGLSIMAGCAGGHGDEKVNKDAVRPNVLLIMADQLRADALGAYGNPVIKTPNLDRLAETGVRFNNCYSQCPVCSPARAVIFTGRYPCSNGVWSNGVPLPQSEMTIAEYLGEDGYATGGAGKFHFIPHFKSELPTMETHPQPYYGFEEFHLGEDQRRGEQQQWIEKNYPEYADKPDGELPLKLHNTHWTTSHAIDFIKRAHGEKKPFFAFCSYVDPHHLYDPPPPYSEMYDPEKIPEPVRREGEIETLPRYLQDMIRDQKFGELNGKWRKLRAAYYGEVTFIDHSIGRLLKTLDSLKIRDNTLIIFISDHGDLLGDHWLWYKGKPHYKADTRVPLIINWKHHLEEGKIIDGIVQQTDIFPTIAGLLGLQLPAGVQGKSLAPVLQSKSCDTGYEYAYMELDQGGAVDPEGHWNEADFDSTLKSFQGPDPYTLRSLRYRFTYYPGYPFGELYDLERDPDEFVNLWDNKDYADVKQNLEQELLNRIIKNRDPLPVREEYY